MALQDLTPQLRTRLSRMERAVGWFVILAAALLIFGFVYYVYNTAQRKGWFTPKVYYQTSISSGEGLKVGDPVRLMGFDVGEITSVEPNDPYDYYNITVHFLIKAPHYGYLWTDSKARVAPGNLLGNRYLEVVKGKQGIPTVLETTNKNARGVLRWQLVEELSKQLTNETVFLQTLKTRIEKNPDLYYTNISKETAYWMQPQESPSVTERLERLVNQVETALPGILDLTNQISHVLSNSAILTSNLNTVAVNAQPAVSNLAVVLSTLDQPGALGDWLLPTNIHRELEGVLGGANSVLSSADTNLIVLAESLGRSLENLAAITGNLNAQVQNNTNILAEISRVVVNTDELVQGLKRHWLLRSAFRSRDREDDPRPSASDPLRSPKDESHQ